MRAYEIRFPSTLGDVVRGIRTYLTAATWTGVTTQPKLPATKRTRMVTVRDDGGTGRNGVLRRRFGVNVWAETPALAESLAADVAAAMRKQLRMVDLTEPIEVVDDADEVLTVGGSSLTHYFLSGVQIVHAENI